MERGTQTRRDEKDRQQEQSAKRQGQPGQNALGGETMTLTYNGGGQNVTVGCIREPNQTAQQWEAACQAKVEAKWREKGFEPVFTLAPMGFFMLEYVSGGVLKQFECDCLQNYPAQSGGTVPGNATTWMRACIKMFQTSWAQFPPDIS